MNPYEKHNIINLGDTETVKLGLMINEYACSMDIELFGVASVTDYTNYFPEMPQPSIFVKNAKSVIVIGLSFNPNIMGTVLKTSLANAEQKRTISSLGGRSNLPIQKFFLQEEIELLKIDLTSMAYKISRFIRDRGFEAMPMLVCKQDDETGKAPFYHMPAMYLSGLGTLGLNCSIITPEFGPRVFVNTIITNCDLPAGKPLDTNLCIGCNLCVKNCPVNAIDGNGWKNIEACYKFNGCSTCIAICPVGRVRTVRN